MTTLAATELHPKIQAAGAAGALTVVLIWVLSMFSVDVPAEAASALTLLFTLGAGYIKSG